MEEEYIRASEFLVKDSEPVTISEDVRRELRQKSKCRIIDAESASYRMNQAWSELANQVVGAEIPRDNKL
jgi:hypothetical protein